ncbi:MAG: BREX-4 system phosphatase PglZ [Bacillota bacterium]|jgi:hypothetical protein|nr:BREX-4 system phosphatase PglZ [Bacillota bacterium]
MHSFTDVKELISHLNNESSKRERFATRFILIQGCQVWKDLIPKLGFEVDRVVRLSELCSGSDVLPDLNCLLRYLSEELTGCHSVMVVPLAECIRLDPECSEVIRLLAEFPTGKLNRIYVPLLAAEEFFFEEMNRVFRFKAGELPDLWGITGKGDAEIIVAPFSTEAAEQQIAKGIKEYLKLWENDSVSKIWLVTSLAPSLPTKQVRSECRVRLYSSSYDFLKKHISLDELCEEWGSADQWEWLALNVNENDNLDSIAGRLLNFTDYDAEQVFVFWSEFDHNERWLAWLWSKMRCEPDTYLYHVLKNCDCIDHFEKHAVMTIFDISRSITMVKERKELLKNLGIKHMDAEFWARFNELGNPLDRVAVLTDHSVEEKEHFVLSVGELLGSDTSNQWWVYVESSFPALAWYLHPTIIDDEFASKYFVLYNRCRLKDKTSENLEQALKQWADKQLLWEYPTRSDLLAEHRKKGAKIFWVDAMGVEWLGLLIHLLTNGGQVECTVRIARGNLPTTTEANKEWEEGEDVERGLDDIAHHYSYKHPQSFLKAIEVVQSIAYKALALLSKYSTVVITSDHGLSRFVVNSKEKIELPEQAVADPHGRYAMLGQKNIDYENGNQWIMDDGNAILMTHSRFKGGVSNIGEIHGGATPEEYLVPVIVARKASADVKLQFDVISPSVKVNYKGEGDLIIRSNLKVDDLGLYVGSFLVKGQSNDGFNWSFTLRHLNSAKYKGKLYSYNRMVGEISFEVIKGIIEEDMGL